MKKSNLQNEARCCRSEASVVTKGSSGFSLFFASVLMILFFQGVLVNSVFGQGGISVHTTDIRANFGIDADLYAKRLLFPPLYPGLSCNSAPILGSLSNLALPDSGTSDDWFGPHPPFPFPTGGIGVLDTNGMAAFRSQLIACGSDAVCKNAMFFGRMAYPSFTQAPYTTGFNVLLDAVGVRDHNAIAAAIDSSAFCATSDKNGHNPKSWCLGVAGTPAKNDLVDVAAHIRQNVVNLTSPADTGLWGYAYATTMSENGDSHLDFELIRCIDYSGAASGANTYLSHPAGNINSEVMFCGPDSGHTAGHHSMATGQALIPGDVLLTADYACGGKKTDIALYVWSDTVHVGPDGTTPFSITQYNTIPNRLFDFCTNNNDPATDPFGGGADYFFNTSGTAPFGYIRIRPKTNDTIFWARVNVYRTSNGAAPEDTTLGPPYGSMISGAFNDKIQQLQEIEIALNFTKAGLAIPPTAGACQQLFGNLMVKTRSSASVTSELKDYVGPVQFGAFTNILLEANGDTLDCAGDAVTLCAHAVSSTPGNITYCWKGPDSQAGPCLATIDPGTNDSCISVSVPGTYYISATLDGGCTVTDSVEVVDDRDVTPPTINCPPNTTIDCPATVEWGNATATDGVDQSVNVTVVSTSSEGTCPTVYTRKWKATDDCGNTATCSATITVRDITPPSISCPSNTTIDCPAPVSWGNATASDACDQTVDISVVSTTPSGTCPTVWTRVWKAQDDCGNTNTCSATITVRDITPPSISCPSNTTIDCPAPVSWGNATASDACDQTVDISVVSTTPSGTCPTVWTRVWKAQDDCGNTNTCSATITVRDITPPSISCPSNTTIDCPAPVSWGNATASDACDQTVDISVVSTTPSGTCPTVWTRVWKAQDDCGNTNTCSATITVRDITPPSISCPSNTTIDCPAPVSWGNATASDACDQTVDISVVSTTPSGTCPTVWTRVWKAQDDCGNTNTCSATITVRDITPPSISCPSNTTIDCPAPVSWGNATASDACDQTVDISVVSTTPSGTCPTVWTRVWKAQDDCGNTNTCSATITVRDITPPSISCPSNTTIDCPAPLSWGNATASDACDQTVDISVVSTTPSGTCPTVWTRVWKAQDDCGNTNTCSATITVRDITPPSISCPSNTTIDCPAPVSWGNATASDACDQTVDISVVSTTPSGTCPTVWTRVWKAQDDCGNTNTCSATITVRDITPPSIHCPYNTTIDCPAPVSWGNATASDACDQTVDITVVSTTPSGTCPTVWTRKWKAQDDCGNTSTCSATITVRDITPPSISCPSSTTIDCPAPVSWGNATASDACDQTVDISVVSTTPSGTCPTVWTRVWKAQDDCGNTNTCSATITVRDVTAPSISCPSNTTIDCPAPLSWGNATASDACDQTVTVSVVSTTPSGTCPTVWTRKWKACDDCGNTSTCSATITVRDISPPSISCPGNVTLNCNTAITWTLPGATDACDQSVDVTVVSTTGDPNSCGNGTVTRTWIATDDCGNTATCSQSKTISNCGGITVIKTTEGVVDPTQDWQFTLYDITSGETTIASASTLNDANGVLFEALGKLDGSKKYKLCETNIPAGWSSVWKLDLVAADCTTETIVAVWNPQSNQVPPQNLGNLCFEFGAGTSYPIIPGSTGLCNCKLLLTIDNSFPGGEPRTPGYWKNWNYCTGGGQGQNAIRNGGCAEGYCVIEDVLLPPGPGITWCGTFNIPNCQTAVYVLDQREVCGTKHAKMSSDAAYTLAMHLLAAELNMAVGAEICPIAQLAATYGRSLLCSINFNACGSFLPKASNPKYAKALCIKDCLEKYNMGNLCFGGTCTACGSEYPWNPTRMDNSQWSSYLLNEEVMTSFPNPVTENATIVFMVGEDTHALLEVYSFDGAKVASLVDREVQTGETVSSDFNASSFAAGIYFCKLTMGGQVYTHRMMISK